MPGTDASFHALLDYFISLCTLSIDWPQTVVGRVLFALRSYWREKSRVTDRWNKLKAASRKRDLSGGWQQFTIQCRIPLVLIDISFRTDTGRFSQSSTLTQPLCVVMWRRTEGNTEKETSQVPPSLPGRRLQGIFGDRKWSARDSGHQVNMWKETHGLISRSRS